MVTNGDTDTGERDGPRRPRLVGATIGVLSGAIAIGVGQLLSGVVGGVSSPIIAVGSSSIDATPEWLKHFAIRTFGANDKRVLLGGIGLVLLVAAIVLGVVSMRRPRVGVIGLLALGGIGALAAVTRPGATLVDAIPAVVGTVVGIAAFLWLRRGAGHVGAEPATDRPVGDTPTGFDRRRFLFGSAVVAGLAATTGFVGEYWCGVRMPARRAPRCGCPASPTPHRLRRREPTSASPGCRRSSPRTKTSTESTPRCSSHP